MAIRATPREYFATPAAIGEDEESNVIVTPRYEWLSTGPRTYALNDTGRVGFRRGLFPVAAVMSDGSLSLSLSAGLSDDVALVTGSLRRTLRQDR